MTETLSPSGPGAVWLVAASCTTGWLDWIHGNLWLASDGLARVPLGLRTTVAHGTNNIDPAKGQHPEISMSEFDRLRGMNSTLWIAADRIESARLHRGLLNDRLQIIMKDGSTHKILWVRDALGTQCVSKVLPGRGWVID